MIYFHVQFCMYSKVSKFTANNISLQLLTDCCSYSLTLWLWDQIPIACIRMSTNSWMDRMPYKPCSWMSIFVFSSFRLNIVPHFWSVTVCIFCNARCWWSVLHRSNLPPASPMHFTIPYFLSFRFVTRKINKIPLSNWTVDQYHFYSSIHQMIHRPWLLDNVRQCTQRDDTIG